MLNASDPTSTRPLGPIVAACFLAVSWTWCIGMFLPIILMRDLGPWAFAAFALPNICGAAAMGWVLATREQAQRIIREHRPVLELFSIVTIAFHVYFLIAMSGPLVPAFGLGPMPLAIVLTLWVASFVVLIRRTMRSLVLLAAPIWLFSVAVLATMFTRAPALPPPLLAAPDSTGLLFLAPVCIFGFALCPYLDLTFHHARIALTAKQSRVAFTLGFGVFFAAMILLTVTYAPLLDPALSPLVIPTWLGAALWMHLFLQATYTIAAHRRVSHPTQLPDTFAWALWLLAAAAAMVTLRLAPYAGLSAFEVGYRIFMSFYGLAFPAYVWLVMIPTQTQTPEARRHAIRVCAAAVGLAAPMFWMGFIERHETWLGFGLAVVVLARLALKRRPRHA
jgi:hypothetical protein